MGAAPPPTTVLCDQEAGNRHFRYIVDKSASDRDVTKRAIMDVNSIVSGRNYDI